MATSGPGIFDNDAAGEFLAGLRAAAPTAVGDAVSGALREVAQAEAPLTADSSQRALAATALLVSALDADVLAGAGDAAEVQRWFAGLEVELNPARRQIAEAVVERLLLADDNGWYDSWSETDDRAAALATVHRLRDLLAEFSVAD